MEWIPEKYPPSGTIGAAGFYKLLGRPQLDPLTVLVRETAQNSWDARSPRRQSVKFAIDGKELSSDERQFLFSSVLPNRHLARGTGLDTISGSSTALYITDRGTIGLGGPFSASDVSDSGVYDWVDFVLNVGKANTQGHTGGTYGFGKTIAYVVSAVNTVVVYSRTRHGGGLQTRLMACAIGSEFEHEGALHTGRHWWGISEAGAPTPLLDEAADDYARQIGMPLFEGTETGTTLMIVEPDFGGRTVDQGMTFLVEAALWNLWPKLVPQPSRGPEMTAKFSWNGTRISVPSPESRPPLGGFVQAFQEMLSDTPPGERPPGFSLNTVGLSRPKKTVGVLATVPIVTRPRPNIDDGFSPTDANSPRSASMIIGPAHHVALIRSPNLVVEYLEGPPSPEASFEWVGVFKAADAEDRVFALAEPPTHDTWRPELIPDRTDKSIVKMALQNIGKILESLWGSRVSTDQGASASTSSVAHQLAHLVGGSRGTGAQHIDRSTDSASPSRRAQMVIRYSGPDDLEMERRTRVDLLVTPAPKTTETELQVGISIALAGGGTDSQADPGLSLRSASVGDHRIELSGTQASITIVGSDPVPISIVAARTTDFSVSFDLQLVEVANR
jgi:hypothetical protein